MTGLSTVALVYAVAFGTRRRRHGHMFGGIGTALGTAGLAALGVGVFVLVAVVVLLIWLFRRARRR
jgi:4-amino-4-deoxy-L-arabinose transferase-like glycosyltransferase